MGVLGGTFSKKKRRIIKEGQSCQDRGGGKSGEWLLEYYTER